MADKNLLVEKEFLALLLLKPELYSLVEIKPIFMLNEENKKIFQAIVEFNSRDDFEFSIPKLKEIAHLSNTQLDYIVEILDSDFIPLTTNVQKHFINDQQLILDNYKKYVINNYSSLLSQNKMSLEEYTEKIKYIENYTISCDKSILTKDEILQNISVKNSLIYLPSYPELSQTLHLQRGDLLVVGGRTGSGKSGFLLNLMNDLITTYQCIYFNMEMSKTTIYQRMVAIRGDIPVKDVANPQTSYQKNKIDETITDLTNNQIIIEHQSSYLEEIKAIISRNKNEDKHTIVFLDHLGLVRTRQNKSLYEQTTMIIKELRQICLDYDCTIIAAAQLNRTNFQADRLTIDMLKDSGELENSASRILMIYKNKNQQASNPEYTDDMIVEIAKNRDGRLGELKFKYDKTKQKFIEIKEVN